MISSGIVKYLMFTEQLPKKTAELDYVDGTKEFVYVGVMKTKKTKTKYKVEWTFPNLVMKRWRDPFFVSSIEEID